MPELIQYNVSVDTGTGAVPRFVIREPLRLYVALPNLDGGKGRVRVPSLP